MSSNWLRGMTVVLTAGVLLFAVGFGHVQADDSWTISSPRSGKAWLTPAGAELATDGNPLFLFTDGTSGAIQILRCGTGTCSEGNSVVETEVIQDRSSKPSLRVDSLNRPVVLFIEYSLDSEPKPLKEREHRVLKILRCGDEDCAHGNSVATITDYAHFAIFDLDAADIPTIVFAGQDFSLNLVRCIDISCTQSHAPVALTAKGDVAPGMAMALDDEGRPVIAYFRREALPGALVMVRCSDLGCTDPPSVSRPDPTSYGGGTISLALDSSGLPVLAYHNERPREKRFLRCSTSDCSANSRVRVIETGAVGISTSLELDSSDNPSLAYRSENRYQLIKCLDPICEVKITTVLESINGEGVVALVLDQSDKPIVAYTINVGSLYELRVAASVEVTRGSQNNPATIVTPPSTGDGDLAP
jgi:hypothetical protein